MKSTAINKGTGRISVFDVSLHVSFLLRPDIDAYVYANEQLGPSVFLCLSPLFFVLQLLNYTKTITRLRLVEFCRIIPSTSSRGLFYIIIQQIVTLSKYGHGALDICHP